MRKGNLAALQAASCQTAQGQHCPPNRCLTFYPTPSCKPTVHTHTATLCSMKNVRKTKHKSVTHIDFHRRMFQEQSLLIFSAPENMSQQKKFTNHFENKGIDQCRDLCLCVEISNIIQEQYLSHSTSTSFSSSSSSSLSSSSSFSSVTSSPPTCDVCSLP